MVEKPAEVLARLRERRNLVVEAARLTAATIAAEVEARRVGPEDTVKLEER